MPTSTLPQRHPGNLAITAIARYAAGNVCLGGEPVPARIVAEARSILMREGRSARILGPSRAQLREHVEGLALAASIEIPRGDARMKALRHLEELRHKVRDGERIDGATWHTWRHLASLATYHSQRKPHPAPLRIAIDIDGCLAAFNETLREWLVHRGWDRERMPDPTTYYLQHAWGLSNEELFSEMRAGLEAGVIFRKDKLMRDGALGARKLGLDGHYLLANSARKVHGVGTIAKRATVEWLRDHHVHVDELYLADPLDPHDKLVRPFDLIIDDNPSNVRAALSAGRGAVLLDRPWNVEYIDLPRSTYAEIAQQPHLWLPAGHGQRIAA